MINIVLHEPEMPANTGNIGRTCVATGVRLHLIGPLGFQINDKMLKRAGLDYWDKLDVTEYDDYKDFLCLLYTSCMKHIQRNILMNSGKLGRGHYQL